MLKRKLSLDLGLGVVQPPLAEDILEDCEMIMIHPWFYDSIDQGTWALLANAIKVYQTCFYNSSHADGDGLNYKAFLLAGTYTLKILAAKDATCGIVKVKIGGVTVMTWDMYNGGGALENQINAETGIIIASDGIKDIQVVVDGTNPLSGDYYLAWQGLALWRTA